MNIWVNDNKRFKLETVKIRSANEIKKRRKLEKEMDNWKVKIVSLVKH